MINLSKENKILFMLIKLALETMSPEEISESELIDVNWNKVCLEACHQSVFLIAFEGLKKIKNIIPEKVFNYWELRSLNHVSSNLNTLYSISETDRIMDSNRYEYAIIKGLSSALYYPDPTVRMLGDVDFYIDPSFRSEIRNTLLSEGYERLDSHNNHHEVFLKPNQDIEMHYDFPGLPKNEFQYPIREYLKDFLSDKKYITVNGKDYRISPEKYHGLIILLHMQQHMLSEGIGLRHILDWYCYSKKVSCEKYFNEKLIPLLKKIGLYKFTCVITKICFDYFGGVCPISLDCNDNILCDEVMNDIIIGGNFGRKNKARSTSGLMMSDSVKYGKNKGKVVSLWNVLIEAVEGYHPIVKKMPILYPVFIIEFTVKRIFRVLTGKRTPIIVSMSYLNERKNVYNKLEIFNNNYPPA